MASYIETILSTQGVLGYWPLYDNGKDASSYHNDMDIVGVVEFLGMNQSPPYKPLGYNSKGDTGARGTVAGYLSLDNQIATRCAELWVKFDHVEGTYNGILGFNQLLGIEHNASRIQFIQRDVDDFNFYTGSIANLSYGVDIDYFKTIKHIVIQYEPGVDKTIVYSNGAEFISANGNAFANLLPNGKTLVGAFTHQGTDPNEPVGFFGGSMVSDFALYDRPLTQLEILERYNFDFYSITNELLSLRSISWGNRETIVQANPQPDVLQYLKQSQSPTLATKQGNYSSTIDQKGKQRAMGYFESKVLIQDVPAPNRKVMCFTQHGQLLDETRSDVLGNYRFDHLLLDTKYLFVAQDNRATPDTPPEYQAVAAGFQSATPYVED